MSGGDNTLRVSIKQRALGEAKVAIAALFGSSWHVMSGPTNANSLALFAMLAPLAIPGTPEYIDLALTVTIVVGKFVQPTPPTTPQTPGE